MGGTYGSSHLNPSDYQIHNAYKMRELLQQQGYDEKAIAGVIGNAQVESGISPGAIQKVSALPNGAEKLSDVPNSYIHPQQEGKDTDSDFCNGIDSHSNIRLKTYSDGKIETDMSGMMEMDNLQD